MKYQPHPYHLVEPSPCIKYKKYYSTNPKENNKDLIDNFINNELPLGSFWRSHLNFLKSQELLASIFITKYIKSAILLAQLMYENLPETNTKNIRNDCLEASEYEFSIIKKFIRSDRSGAPERSSLIL